MVSHWIEGSPDHWWVTTRWWPLYQCWWNWRVTRSLVSYDMKTTSLTCSFSLKGHQIIGELRQINGSIRCWDLIEGSPDHWWVTTNGLSCFDSHFNWRVTRSLVSYDIYYFKYAWWTGLKGHQIIGELRLLYLAIVLLYSYWRVTRSLVSYDRLLILPW